MKSSHWVIVLTTAAWLWALPAAQAGQHTSRTYFGRPPGPQGPKADYRNPWTGRIFGFRYCLTPEEKYQRFLKEYQITQVQHLKRLEQLDWEAYDQHVAQHGCAPGCETCPAPSCERAPIQGVRGLFSFLCPADKRSPCDEPCCQGASKPCQFVPPHLARQQAMSREDALRYLEGFQYYPPYHLLRSPRDFYMFDTKYGYGR